MDKRITINPAICHGKPVIEGTRVLVSAILGALENGDSEQEIAEDYCITLEQIEDAKLFGKRNEIPESHKEILDNRRKQVANGEEKLLDWDQVKDDLGSLHQTE